MLSFFRKTDRRKAGPAIVAAVAVSALAATAAFTVIAAGQSAVPTLQSLLPRDTLMAAEVQSDWLWNNTASIRSAPAVSKLISQAEQASGLSIENDILPWAGQVAVAGYHMTQNDGDVAIYAQIRDTGKFMATLAKLQAKLQTPATPGTPAPMQFSTRDYHGTTVYDLTKVPGLSGTPAAFAIVNGWAIAGIGKGAIEHALDVYLGQYPSIASSPYWSQVEAKLPQNPQVWTGIDVGGVTKAFGGSTPYFTGSTSEIARTCIGFAFTDTGNGLRFDEVGAAETPAGQALYAQLAHNLKPVSGDILSRVPDAVLVSIISNPAYLWKWTKLGVIDSQPTVKAKHAMAASLNQPMVDDALSGLHKEAGFAITWRKDRGFGLVLLAHADSHDAALHTAKIVAAAVKKLGIPMERGGNSWSAAIPGIQMMIPPPVPVKLAPFLSAKDDWVVIGSNPTWTASSGETPNLTMPAGSSDADTVCLMSMQWLPSVYTLIETQAPPDDTNVSQGIALARGLGLENSVWSAVANYDPSGQYWTGEAEISNWNWHAAIDNTVNAIENWKPAATPGIGHDLLKKPNVSQAGPVRPSS